MKKNKFRKALEEFLEEVNDNMITDEDGDKLILRDVVMEIVNKKFKEWLK